MPLDLSPSLLRDNVPSVVLDTNVVLDWLYFEDGRCGALDQAIRSRRIRWIASAPMRDELEHVLGRGIGGKIARSGDAVRTGWRRWADMAAVGDAPSPRQLRCSDPDDQKFIDFALHAGAACLLSGDRAVLRLARPAAALGLAIVPIERWAPPEPASACPAASS